MSNPQTDILSRITASRSPEAPESGQAEKVETETLEPEVLETQEDSSEASEVEQEEIEHEESYVNIGDREISFKQISDWENGSLMQSDYTQKTQALAEDRKSFESSKQSFSEKESSLDGLIDSLSDIIDSNKTEIDWEDLKEYDPGEYVKQKELLDSRKQKLSDAKKVKSSLKDETLKTGYAKEQKILLDANPNWLKDGKTTDAYDSDMKEVNTYLIKNGYTPEDQKSIVSAKHWQAIITAAKYEQSKVKTETASKKLRAAPVVTRPGGQSRSTNVVELDKAKAAHRKHGTTATALALRKANKKYRG